jgi:DNA-binding MarR family transcriptional regulator
MRRRGARRLPTTKDYERLAQWRQLLRRFLLFSEVEALRAGLTARQHQALLVIKGFGHRAPLNTGSLADCLLIRPHSAVGLVDRLVRKRLVRRRRAAAVDRRQVMLELTARAERLISRLAASHRDELATLAPLLQRLLRHFSASGRGGASGAHSGPAAGTRPAPAAKAAQRNLRRAHRVDAVSRRK